jgi:hypothetical protein
MKSIPENDSVPRPIFCWRPVVPPGPGRAEIFAVVRSSPGSMLAESFSIRALSGRWTKLAESD